MCYTIFVPNVRRRLTNVRLLSARLQSAYDEGGPAGFFEIKRTGLMTYAIAFRREIGDDAGYLAARDASNAEKSAIEQLAAEFEEVGEHWLAGEIRREGWVPYSHWLKAAVEEAAASAETPEERAAWPHAEGNPA